MIRAFFAFALLLMLTAIGPLGSAETITFAGLANPYQADPFFSPVGPLTFYDFYVTGFTDQNNMIIPGTEYIYAGYYPFEPPPYPYYLPYSPDTAEFYSTSGETFTLNTMNIGLYPGIEFYGYRKGVLVDEGNTGTDVDPITGDPILNWTNIDAVVFPNVVDDDVSLNIYNITINEGLTPEPASFALLGTGILGLFAVARRRLCS